MRLYKGLGHDLTPHFLLSPPISPSLRGQFPMTCSSREYSSWPSESVHSALTPDDLWVCQISAAQTQSLDAATGIPPPSLGQDVHTLSVGCDVNTTAKASLLGHSRARVESYDVKKTRKDTRGEKYRVLYRKLPWE